MNNKFCRYEYKHGIHIINVRTVGNSHMKIIGNIQDFDAPEGTRCICKFVLDEKSPGRVCEIGFKNFVTDERRNIVNKILEAEDWFVSNCTKQYVYTKTKSTRKTKSVETQTVVHNNIDLWNVVYEVDGVKKVYRIYSSSKGYAIYRFRKKNNFSKIIDIFSQNG